MENGRVFGPVDGERKAAWRAVQGISAICDIAPRLGLELPSDFMDLQENRWILTLASPLPVRNVTHGTVCRSFIGEVFVLDQIQHEDTPISICASGL